MDPRSEPAWCIPGVATKLVNLACGGFNVKQRARSQRLLNSSIDDPRMGGTNGIGAAFFSPAVFSDNVQQIQHDINSSVGDEAWE